MAHASETESEVDEQPLTLWDLRREEDDVSADIEKFEFGDKDDKFDLICFDSVSDGNDKKSAEGTAKLSSAKSLPVDGEESSDNETKSSSTICSDAESVRGNPSGKGTSSSVTDSGRTPCSESDVSDVKDNPLGIKTSISVTDSATTCSDVNNVKSNPPGMRTRSMTSTAMSCTDVESVKDNQLGMSRSGSVTKNRNARPNQYADVYRLKYNQLGRYRRSTSVESSSSTLSADGTSVNDNQLGTIPLESVETGKRKSAEAGLSSSLQESGSKKWHGDSKEYRTSNLGISTQRRNNSEVAQDKPPKPRPADRVRLLQKKTKKPQNILEKDGVLALIPVLPVVPFNVVTASTSKPSEKYMYHPAEEKNKVRREPPKILPKPSPNAPTGDDEKIKLPSSNHREPIKMLPKPSPTDASTGDDGTGGPPLLHQPQSSSAVLKPVAVNVHVQFQKSVEAPKPRKPRAILPKVRCEESESESQQEESSETHTGHDSTTPEHTASEQAVSKTRVAEGRRRKSNHSELNSRVHEWRQEADAMEEDDDDWQVFEVQMKEESEEDGEDVGAGVEEQVEEIDSDPKDDDLNSQVETAEVIDLVSSSDGDDDDDDDGWCGIDFGDTDSSGGDNGNNDGGGYYDDGSGGGGCTGDGSGSASDAANNDGGNCGGGGGGDGGSDSSSKRGVGGCDVDGSREAIHSHISGSHCGSGNTETTTATGTTTIQNPSNLTSPPSQYQCVFCKYQTKDIQSASMHVCHLSVPNKNAIRTGDELNSSSPTPKQSTFFHSHGTIDITKPSTDGSSVTLTCRTSPSPKPNADMSSVTPTCTSSVSQKQSTDGSSIICRTTVGQTPSTDRSPVNESHAAVSETSRYSNLSEEDLKVLMLSIVKLAFTNTDVDEVTADVLVYYSNRYNNVTIEEIHHLQEVLGLPLDGLVRWFSIMVRNGMGGHYAKQSSGNTGSCLLCNTCRTLIRDMKSHVFSKKHIRAVVKFYTYQTASKAT